ncbi:MAG: 5-(carboxyamino)imidazole ribonucleotide synthase [Chloroflexi bacterium]|nr:5-(carboxyamino)imidazole ribonucleotide synthase [Chloroflexota bacterium]
MGPLGILGGGQLGRMTLQAASRLGIDVVIAERFADSPAARLTSQSLVFPNGWDDPRQLDELARLTSVVTLESEFVDWRVLEALDERGVPVRPTPACIGVVQDKLLQKQALARAELPVPAFSEIASPDHLRSVGDELGWPLMLKARRDGYDGRGNVVVHARDECESACQRLGWPERALYAEAFIDFERELASLVVRSLDGSTQQYPVVETIQDPGLHICREVLAPADVSEGAVRQAASIARAAVEAVDGLGAFGVEMFLLTDGQVVVNELAPRPHNSAHYTIDACWSSQFDNHVRAVLGLPLGDTGLREPAAVMVNLLGTSSDPLDAAAALEAEPGIFVHLYGKADNRPGRKMGHVTAVGSTLLDARERATSAAGRVRV